MQRVSRAAVRVDAETVGEIGMGLVVLLGVGPTDDTSVAAHLAERVATLRILSDAEGRMNLDLAEVGAAVLVVSQFTLYGDSSRGHRPSFVGAAAPGLAQQCCAAFAEALQRRGLPVAQGRFGAHMDVEMVNQGPVTLVLSSSDAGWRTDAG